MWPKALMQLLEFMPHITRMLPLADRYLASRSAQDQATVEAIGTLSEGMRGDLGKVAKAHVEMARQLDSFSARVEEVGAEARGARTAAETARSSAELASNHAREVETELRSLRVWIKVGILVIVALLLVIISLLLREHQG